jgi:hypothetical protein
MKIETEKDLQGLIDDKIQEDTNIDYKEPIFPKTEKFNSELAKDVSAMANSDGGIIIFGIKEEGGFPIEIKWIKEEEDKKYKERIEQIIDSKIFDKIKDIEVRKVLSDDKTRFIIVIEIQQSDIAPHQVHEDSIQRRYYNRHGSITSQMEHYEIKDLFHKRKIPLLRIILIPEWDRDRTIININILNLGKIIAEKTLIFLRAPKDFEISAKGWNKIEEQRCNKFEYYQDDIPFYPEIQSNIGKLYTTKKKTRADKLKIIFMITCKDMPVKRGELDIDMEMGRPIHFEEKIYKENDTPNSPSVIWDEYMV